MTLKHPFHPTHLLRTRESRRMTFGALATLAVGAVAVPVLLAQNKPQPTPAPAAAQPAAAQPAAARPAGGNVTPFVANASVAPKGDMLMWGGTPHRNMISAEKGAPTDWDVGDPDKPGDGKNIKWEAELGSKAYGNPIVTHGMVIVGTNNESKKDPRYANPDGSAIDGGVLMAFDEKTGEFLWQKYYAKLPSGRVNDWPGEGLCSTPLSDGGKLYYCTNRCEVVCLDLSPGNAPKQEPKELWKLDLMRQLGVFPHNMTSSAPASWGDYIYIITGNGVDDTHKNVVAPKAPAIVCIDKNTGKVVWHDNAPGENVLHGQWSSVAITEVKRPDGTVQPLVIAPLGDGWVYAYDARDGKPVWKFDSNPKESVYPQTRNELISTPVIWENRMYIANGQDPEHGTGYAHLWCVDITKTGDVSAEISQAPKPKVGEELVAPQAQVPNRKGQPNPNNGVVWHYFTADDNGDGKIQDNERFHRSIGTVAISADGLLFATDFNGYVHCMDARSGKHHWAYDMEADIWASPLLVDGKVYATDGDGDVAIFNAAKDAKEPTTTINMGASVYGTPVMANGTLYIMSMHKLFAIGTAK